MPGRVGPQCDCASIDHVDLQAPLTQVTLGVFAGCVLIGLAATAVEIVFTAFCPSAAPLSLTA